MRQTGTRSARARRRAAKHTSQVPTPDGWVDPDTLITELDINGFAAGLLENMKPEVMRTVLQRTDVKVRRAVLEPHNIPSAKVSLRAAGQVLSLVRSEDKPAESPILGTLLSPAGTLFDEAELPSTALMGLRLKLIEVALPLIAKTDPVFQGLRTWHRWCDESFEDITMATVIGRRCSHAALAASFLAVNHPEIAEPYEQMLQSYPRMPRAPWARLTPLNPVSRYLAARPDRKLPANTGELLQMLDDDHKVRHAETTQSQSEEPHEDQPAPVDEAPPVNVLPAPHDPRDDLPALPDVMEWANAVTYSRHLTEQLIAGQLPDVAQAQALLDLSHRVQNLATVASRVLRRTVDPDRFAVDRALTEILADPVLSQQLGGMPGTVADVAAVLQTLPEFDADIETPGRHTEAASEEPPETDLSDLDNMLRGETGAQLTAIAAPTRGSFESGPPAPRAPVDDVPEQAPSPSDDPVEAPTPPAPSPPTSSSAVDKAVARMVAIALSAQHPGGALSEEYARIVAGLDFQALESDRLTRAVALCTAMPMALLDASCGAGNLLFNDIPELSGCPRVLDFHESIAELARHGIGVYDPPVRKLTNVMTRFNTVKERAAQLRDNAATKTLKYDKATKVYRAWFAPAGRLRPLVDALASGKDTKHIADLAEDARKVGVTRAINDTLAEELGSGRTKIVAGARQALKDVYDEVLAIADDNRITMQAAMRQHTSDRSAAWRFEQVANFRDRLHANFKTIEAEVESPECPHAVVFGMVLRAMSIGLSPLPASGPEIDMAAAMRYAYPYQTPRGAT